MPDRAAILLIAYQFCPKGRIGTRRWSKFAKYLSEAGITVHVLAARYPYEDTVNWCADVRNRPRIVIHTIPDAYPPALLRAERTWGMKLGERLLQRTFFPLEYAQHWHRWLLPAARRLIAEHGIDTVLTTGAPFTPFSAAVRLKEYFPDLRVWLDFRDPWSSRLPAGRRRSRAVAIEARSMAAADGVLFTTPEHLTHYAGLHAHVDRRRLHVLHNGFDPADFAAIAPRTRRPLSLVYPGAVLLNRLHTLAGLLRALEEQATAEQLATLRIDIYATTPVPVSLLPIADQERFRRFVRILDPLPPAELNRRMAEYSYGLVLNSADHPYIVPAKTYTFMGLGLEMVYLSPPTAMSRLLAEAGQLVATDTGAELAAVARRLLAADAERTVAGSRIPAYEQFAIDRLTQTLLTYLK
jgi:glycosyltransferase involved in cell wall biosynthesis